MGKKPWNSRAVSFLIIALLMILVSACSNEKSTSNTSEKGTEKAGPKKTNAVLSIGTTPVGVSYNSIGNGLAKVLSTNSSLKVSVKPTNGVSAWGPQLDKGDIELGVGSGPDMAWAFKGENGYQPIKNMRMLVRGNYLEEPGAVVRKDADINSMVDLKGKKVAADYPGSIIAKKILEAALAANGLSWDDVQQVPIPTTAAGIEALQDNRVQAAFALTPTTPIIQEVHNAVGLKAVPFIDNVSVNQIKDVPQSVVKKITTIVPGVIITKVQANGYIQEDMVGVEYPTQMVASAHLSDDAVYEIMETLWAHYKELQPIHDWFKTWSTDTFFDPEPTIPYHPGAVKFFKDNGLWNDDVDKIQQELLKLAK